MYSTFNIKQHVLVLAGAIAVQLSALAQSPDKNYVLTESPSVPITSEAALPALTSDDKVSTINYSDGLGRPIQNITIEGSPTKHDQIMFTEYDRFGRESTQYLPFSYPANGGNYVGSTSVKQAAFYSGTSKVPESTVPFGETVFENSPLGRVVETSAPGSSWQLGGGHTLQTSFRTNTINDEVWVWEMNEATNLPEVRSYFDPGSGNLLAYTGFEGGGNIGNWQYTDNGAGNISGLVAAPAPVYAGTFAYYLYGADNNVSISGLDPSKSYVVSFYGQGAGGVLSVAGQYVNLTADWELYEFTFDNITDVLISGTGSSNRYIDVLKIWEIDPNVLVSCNGFECEIEGEGDGVNPCSNIEAYFWEWGGGPPSQLTSENGISPHTGSYFYRPEFYPVTYTQLDDSKTYRVTLYTNGVPESSGGSSLMPLLSVNGQQVACGNNSWVQREVMISGSSSLTITLDPTGSTSSYLDDICIYEVNYDQFLVPEVYPPSTLWITTKVNEHGFAVTEYANKQGQLILLERETGEDANPTNSTYFVYDDYGHERAVLPPKTMGKLFNGAWLDVSPFADWIFRYQYDGRNRVVEKDMPDSEPHHIVYDNMGRVMFTQTGKQRNEGKWAWRKYDRLNRPVLEGVVADARSRQQLQTDLSYLQNTATIGNCEQRSSANFATNQGYTNNVSIVANSNALRVSYYDDYDFDRDGLADKSYTADPASSFTNTSTDRVRNKVTGTKAKILNVAATSFNSHTYFFDSKGQVVQALSENPYFQADPDITFNEFAFTGLQLRSKTIHAFGGANELVWSTRSEHDHMGRVSQHFMQIGSDPEVMLQEQEFNQLGSLVESNIHSTDGGSTFLQSIDYRYNIRGWLTHINNCALENDESGIPGGDSPTKGGGGDSGNKTIIVVGPGDGGDIGIGGNGTNDDGNDLFGMNIHYDVVPAGISASALYTGDISAVCWQAASDNQRRSYGYEYDALRRLTQANFSEYSATTLDWTQNVGRFDVYGINYDANGNILNMQRKGWGNNFGWGNIDNLSYGYDGNRLLSVHDNAIDQGSFDFDDNGSNSAIEYAYDGSGNLVSDNNKGITVTYNELGLPHEVDFGSGGKLIRFLYDAEGTKMQRQVYQNGQPPLYTTYKGALTYENGSPVMLATHTGRAVPSGGGSYAFEHYIHDHIGNVRVAFCDLNQDGSIDASTEVLQENHFYPFGMELDGLATPQIGPENPYKFQGKEMSATFGLNWYDFDARQYDPQLGRWHAVDQLARKWAEVSPMSYGLNNPIRFRDPDGRDIVDIWGNPIEISRDANGKLSYLFNANYSEYQKQVALDHFNTHTKHILEAMNQSDMGRSDIDFLAKTLSNTKIRITSQTYEDEVKYMEEIGAEPFETNSGDEFTGEANSVLTLGPLEYSNDGKTVWYQNATIRPRLDKPEYDKSDFEEWLSSSMHVERVHLESDQIMIENTYSSEYMFTNAIAFNHVYARPLNEAVLLRISYRKEHGQPLTDDVFNPVEKMEENGYPKIKYYGDAKKARREYLKNK